MLTLNNIFDEVSLNLKDNCIITGGHFRIFFKKGMPALSLNAGTIISFDYAVKLYLHAVSKKIKTDLGILINDLGSPCDEDGCHIKASGFIRKEFSLPQEYTEILSKNGLKNYPLKIYWEKHIRNRGKKELLKLLKSENVFHMNNGTKIIQQIIKENNGMFLNDPEGYGKIILTKTQGKDKYGTPACPLIMSSFSIEQSKFYNSTINFYYIGEDNIQNIPNYNVIEKGKRICELLGCNIAIKNIYFKTILNEFF